MYTCSVVYSVVKETGVVRILDDGTCIHNSPSEFIHFRGSCASIYVLFFFNWLRISRRFHFFSLEHLQMKSDGRTVRTTVRTPPRMNMGGPLVTVGKETRNSSRLILKIMVF